MTSLHCPTASHGCYERSELDALARIIHSISPRNRIVTLRDG